MAIHCPAAGFLIYAGAKDEYSRSTHCPIRKRVGKRKEKNHNIKVLEEILRQKKIDDARREMLVGAAILSSVDSGEWPRDRLMAILDLKLMRNEDRDLFNLLPVHRPDDRA